MKRPCSTRTGYGETLAGPKRKTWLDFNGFKSAFDKIWGPEADKRLFYQSSQLESAIQKFSDKGEMECQS